MHDTEHMHDKVLEVNAWLKCSIIFNALVINIILW